MADDTTSDSMLTKGEEKAYTGPLSLAGAKGKAMLNPEASADVRDRLMQMIKEREGYSGSWRNIADLGALAAAAPGGYSAAYNQYRTNQDARERELMELHMGVGQLKSQEEAIKLARAQQEAQRQGFINILTGGAPQGALPASQAGAEAPQQLGTSQGALPTSAGQAPAQGPIPARGAPSPLVPLTNEQRAMLYQLNLQDPKAATQKYLELTKMDEVKQRLLAAGIQPGSPEWNTALFGNVIGSGAVVPHDVRTPTGTGQTTPFQSTASIVNRAGAPAPVQAGAPAPVQAGAPAPVQAGAPAPAPAPAPASIGGFAPGTKEELELRKREQEKAQDVRASTETEQMTKIDVPEEATLAAASGKAANDLIMAARISDNVKKYPTLVGKLANPTPGSALMNFVSQGFTLPVGSVGISSINEIATQLDPDMMKLPPNSKARQDRMTAARQLATDFAQLQLRGSALIQGQGSVSDNERRLISQAVGDYTRMTPKGILIMTKAMELEAHNAKEKQSLWNSMRKTTKWQDFKSSPQYKSLEKQQFYRTANALGLPDAKWVD